MSEYTPRQLINQETQAKAAKVAREYSGPLSGPAAVEALTEALTMCTNQVIISPNGEVKALITYKGDDDNNRN